MIKLSGTMTLAAALLLPGIALAHPEAIGQANSFRTGLMHPLTGLDHVLAMLAVGLWGMRLGGINAWLAPAAFLAAMTTGLFFAGGALGATATESLVALSVIALGIILAFGKTLPRPMMIIIVICAGFAHGAAHANASQALPGFRQFAAGALLATALLHVSGAGLGALSTRLSNTATRIAGAGVALAGLNFLMSSG